MAINKERVLEVEHFTDRLFRIKLTRDKSLRFRDGEFLMIGLDHFSEKLQKNKPIMRAYSVISPSHQETLEFYSIKVQDGPLTSKLQHIQVGDEVLVNTKSVGTLVTTNVKNGRTLYMMSTGTGISPFLSLVRGFNIYDNYDNVVLLHGVRNVTDLSFDDYLNNLNEDEIYKEITQGKFKYYPTVTREEFKHEGRVTDAMYSGKVQEALGLEEFDKEKDRVMICGSMEMNLELQEYFEGLGLVEGTMKEAGEYVLEKAFVG
ncbi:MAG: ferredoxin--NADP reductase [Candidatus Endolissoclinum sp.]|nr:ferredoxin--NADP reductase [Candidatus Endolissoclinum sp.]